MIRLLSWLSGRRPRHHFEGRLRELKVGRAGGSLAIEATGQEAYKARDGELYLRGRTWQLQLQGNDANRFMAAAGDAREARTLPIDGVTVKRVNDDTLLVKMKQGDLVRGSFVMAPHVAAEALGALAAALEKDRA